MSIVHRPLSLFSCLLLVLLSLAPSCEARDPEPAMFNRSKLLNLVNRARVEGRYCGKTWYAPASRLSWDDKLEAAAKEHSVDMYQNNFFSHKGSNGRFVDDRLYTQHYFWKSCGENVAYGMLYEDDVIEEWLGSPGHCANIMNPLYTEMGAWLTGLYWTQVLAKPQN